MALGRKDSTRGCLKCMHHPCVCPALGKIQEHTTASGRHADACACKVCFEAKVRLRMEELKP